MGYIIIRIMEPKVKSLIFLVIILILLIFIIRYNIKNNKKSLRCTICGKSLHGGSGDIVSGTSKQMSNYMLSKANYCTYCQKAFCLDCCLLSAAQKGKSSIWDCPECGKEFPRL